MNKIEKVNYWVTSSENDWQVARHLFEKGDYAHALFFGHLTLEKLLKAVFVSVNEATPPMTHRLVYLAERSGLRAHSKITSHFPISASGHLRPPLNREVLEIVHYSCGFTQSRRPNPTQI